MKEIKLALLNLLNSRSCAVAPDDAMETLKIESQEELLAAAHELEAEAQLIITKRKKFISPIVCGFEPARVVSYAKGFIFVRPIFGGDDIYVPIERTRQAMVNDLVMINQLKDSQKGRSGAVERIVAQGERMLTGIVIRSDKGAEFYADNFYRGSIPIKKMHTEGAKNFDKVQAHLYMEKNHHLIFARVIKIYGTAMKARVCADSIIDANGIPTVFSDATIDLAKRILNRGVKEKDLIGRRNLREDAVFTIDGADAKDLDDAISIKSNEAGWELSVHIADVSYYVRGESAIDQDAKLRGTSVYFADRVIPMLPEELSNGICSLNAGVDRLTFSVIMQISKIGEILHYEFCKSVINSKVRGVYTEVNSILSGEADNDIKEKYLPVLQSIGQAKELANVLEKRAKARGNMDLETHESRFTLDDNGVCVDISLRERGESEKIIEHFMIMANQAAALYAKSVKIPFIYRVHEAPDPDRVRSLLQIAGLLGFKNNRLKANAQSIDFARLVDEARDTPAMGLISNQVLRTMAKAKYDFKPTGHFGLSLEDYCHFTSPIRRYPDTAIHRILSNFLENNNAEISEQLYADFVKRASLSSSECELRAMRAERDTESCYMAEYAGQHIGEMVTGKISGVTQRGIFVMLANSVEGFVSLEHFPACRFVFDGIISHQDELSGKKLVIGDDITVKIVSADVSSGDIDFMPVQV